MSAAVYLDMKDRAQEPENWKSREKAIAEVAKAAKQLRSAIDALDERSAELFWSPDQFKPAARATEYALRSCPVTWQRPSLDRNETGGFGTGR